METYHEAKSEERPALEDMAGHVAAVVTLTDDALVAVKLAPEGLFSACEEEEHCARL
jgi:hypothetical protein